MADDKHGKSIKNDAQYEALRAQGASKEKAARIANTPDAARKGARSEPYEQWTRDALYDKARQIDIDGRSRMSKQALIQALRSH